MPLIPALGLLVVSLGSPQSAPVTTRLAIVETSWDQTEFDRTVLQIMRSEMAQLQWLSLVEPALVQSAVAGWGYDGSLNFTLAQARNLGAAIGCDSYLLGRGRVEPQSRGADQLVHRAWLALFLVDARSGRLANFAFLLHERSAPEEASTSLLTELKARLPSLLDQARWHPSHQAASLSVLPPAIDLESLDQLTPTGELQPPRILISPKPTYTQPAYLADATATVDLKVTFLSDGTIGPIEVVRWAGFGLDESAVEAARRIRFRPAIFKGQPVAVRALVQYKFHLKTQETSTR